jgi:catechol 2,3-dioxygenase-like lactoylglutathione lyase family enzyme
MDWKLELVAVPVSDVDRAKAFYVDKIGFNPDHDHTISDDIRFVQLTPPGSGCSIAIGKGLTGAKPGSAEGLQLVVADIEAAKAELAAAGSTPARSRTSPGGGSSSLPIPTATAGPCSSFRRDSRLGFVGLAVVHPARCPRSSAC